MSFDDVEDFVEEVFERHGAGVGGLLAAHEFGLDVGWGQLDDFDAGGLKLVAEGLGPGVDRGLGGAVGGRGGARKEGKAGGDIDDRSLGLLLQPGEKRGGEAQRTEQVGRDDGLGGG